LSAIVAFAGWIASAINIPRDAKSGEDKFTLDGVGNRLHSTGPQPWYCCRHFTFRPRNELPFGSFILSGDALLLFLLKPRELFSSTEFLFRLWVPSTIILWNALVVPNDLLFVHDPLYLGVLWTARVVSSVMTLVLLVAGLQNWAAKTFFALATWLVVCVVLQTILVLLSRPADFYTVYFSHFGILAFLLFAVPAPIRAIVIGTAVYVVAILFKVWFSGESIPLLYKVNISGTYGMLTVLGLLHLYSSHRLRLLEVRQKQALADELRFKEVMANAGFNALVLVRSGLLVDGNHAFWDLISRPQQELMGHPWTEVFEEDEPFGKIKASGLLKTADAILPVEVERRPVADLDADLLVLRDRSIEAAGLLANTLDWKGRVTNLQLSDREKEIVRALIEGWPRATIADRLFISEDTVKSHISRVYRKLGVGSKVALFRLLAG